MSQPHDDPADLAVNIIERLFVLLVGTRRVVRELEPRGDREESSSAEAERQLYYALLGAIEAGLVRLAEDALTVVRQASRPLGPMGPNGSRGRSASCDSGGAGRTGTRHAAGSCSRPAPRSPRGRPLVQFDPRADSTILSARPGAPSRGCAERTPMLKVALVVTFALLVVPVVGEAAISDGCLPSPFPTTPTPPVEINRDVGFSGDRMHFTVWREPCRDGSGSVPMLRATPIDQSPFLCDLDFQVLQNDMQVGPLDFLTSSGGQTFCTNLLLPQTFAMTKLSGPTFDDKQAFVLVYDQGFGGTPRFLQMPVAAAPAPPLPVSLAGAAILPGSRAVQVGQAATAFATIIATGPGTATGCAIAPTNAPVGTTFDYQQTNAANVPIGTPNTPATIAGGSGQSFVISLTPTQPFPATELHFAFDCTNTNPAPDTPGVNTLLLTSSTIPTPDIVALGATLTNDGIVNIPGISGTGIFSVASVNVGASSSIVVTADTGSAALPVALTLCQTNPQSGACINPTTPGPNAALQINANETPTFAVFVQGQGNVPFSPGVNRVFVRFKTPGGATVGATSAAVRTQ